MGLKDTKIIGPSGTIINGKSAEDGTQRDDTMRPAGTWPMDHEALIATFELVLHSLFGHGEMFADSFSGHSPKEPPSLYV